MTEIKKLRKPVLSFQLISEGIVRQLHQPVVHGARQLFQSPAPDKKICAVISTGPGPAGGRYTGTFSNRKISPWYNHTGAERTGSPLKKIPCSAPGPAL